MIELLNCFKSYDGEQTYIIKNLSLKIEQGDMIAIIGKSGTGKTTLLNILGSLDSMQKGSYTFDGLNIEKMKSNRLYEFRNENVGFIFQEFFLVSYLTVLENILLPVMHLNKKDILSKKDEALKILTEMGMEKLAYRKASKLSGGEKQRVAIARAIINKPKLILADEPTGNLDNDNENIILNELVRINKNDKVTVVIVTHNEDIIKLCNKTYILDNGVLTRK